MLPRHLLLSRSTLSRCCSSTYVLQSMLSPAVEFWRFLSSFSSVSSSMRVLCGVIGSCDRLYDQSKVGAMRATEPGSTQPLPNMHTSALALPPLAHQRHGHPPMPKLTSVPSLTSDTGIPRAFCADEWAAWTSSKQKAWMMAMASTTSTRSGKCDTEWLTAEKQPSTSSGSMVRWASVLRSERMMSCRRGGGGVRAAEWLASKQAAEPRAR